MLALIKSKLDRVGKSVADVSRETGLPYQRLSGYVNGYWALSDEQQNAFDGCLKRAECRIHGKPGRPDEQAAAERA